MSMKVIKKVLPNGLRILLVPMKDSATCTLSVMVQAGSNYESKEESGLSHFLEHMCFKGTARRSMSSQIFRELDELGAQANASTSRYYTEYYVKALPEHFNHVLDIVSDLYLNPIFPEAEIEKEKQVVCDEIDMYEDDPQSVASELLTHTMYGNQSAGRDIAGTKDNVRSFNRERVVAYRSKHYVASKTIITLAGAFSVNTAFAAIKKAFASIPGGPHKNPSPYISTKSGVHVAVKEKKSEQTHVRIGFVGFKRTHKNRRVANILASILGAGMSSRLFIRLREEMGVSYYNYAQHGSNAQYGGIFIGAGVHASHLEKTLHAIHEECIRLTKEKVPSGELEKIKQMYIASLRMGLETSNAVSDYVSDFELYREKYMSPQAIEKEIKAITEKDIQRVAKALFLGKDYTLAVVGPHTEKEVRAFLGR